MQQPSDDFHCIEPMEVQWKNALNDQWSPVEEAACMGVEYWQQEEAEDTEGHWLPCISTRDNELERNTKSEEDWAHQLILQPDCKHLAKLGDQFYQILNDSGADVN